MLSDASLWFQIRHSWTGQMQQKPGPHTLHFLHMKFKLAVASLRHQWKSRSDELSALPPVPDNVGYMLLPHTFTGHTRHAFRIAATMFYVSWSVQNHGGDKQQPWYIKKFFISLIVSELQTVNYYLSPDIQPKVSGHPCCCSCFSWFGPLSSNEGANVNAAAYKWYRIRFWSPVKPRTRPAASLYCHYFVPSKKSLQTKNTKNPLRSLIHAQLCV